MDFSPWFLGRTISLSPAKPSAFFRWLIDRIGRLYTRLAMNICDIRVVGPDLLCDQYRKAMAGGSRFMVAFRHPGDADPQLMYLAMNTLLKKAYRRAGLPARPGAHFIAGAEIPLWGGPLVAWTLSKAGTIPVSHGSSSRQTMEIILDTLCSSIEPVVLAPEGQVSYVSSSQPDIDKGAAQLALWALQRLQARASPVQEVCILPVGIHYTYRRETPKRLDTFLAKLEVMVSRKAQSGRTLPEFADRLRLIWQNILDKAEAWYTRVYGFHTDTMIDQANLRERSFYLCEFALQRAEAYYGRSSGGTLRDRVMYLRAHTAKLTFTSDPAMPDHSEFERQLYERAAQEAYWLHRHQEIADLAWYLHEHDIGESLDFHVQVEAAANLYDFATRFFGGSFGTRSLYFRKSVELRFAPAIAVASESQLGRKAALQIVSDQLAKAFQDVLAKAWS